MRWTAETLTDENRRGCASCRPPCASTWPAAPRSSSTAHAAGERVPVVRATVARPGADRQRRGGRPVLLRTHPRGVSPRRRPGAIRGVRSVGCGTEGDARARYAVVYIGDPDIAVGFRSFDYDHLSVVRDLTARGCRSSSCAFLPRHIRTFRRGAAAGLSSLLSVVSGSHSAPARRPRGPRRARHRGRSPRRRSAPAGLAVDVADGSTEAELRGRVDDDVHAPRRHECGVDDRGDGARIVDGRCVEPNTRW